MQGWERAINTLLTQMMINLLLSCYAKKNTRLFMLTERHGDKPQLKLTAGGINH